MKTHDQKSKAEREAEIQALVEKTMNRDIRGVNVRTGATFKAGGQYVELPRNPHRTLMTDAAIAKKLFKEKRKSRKKRKRPD